MTLARENQGNFEEYLGNNPIAHPGIDLSVTVLTTGFWPSYKSSDLSLLSEMVIAFFKLWEYKIVSVDLKFAVKLQS